MPSISIFFDLSSLLGLSVFLLVSIFSNQSPSAKTFANLDDVFELTLDTWACLIDFLSLVFGFSGKFWYMWPGFPQHKNSPACIIFVLPRLSGCACVLEMSLELWSETQAYVVSVLLVNLIVLFEDTENWSRATRLVNSVGGISRVRKRFSSNSGISWLINIGVSHLVKQEWELNVCVCVWLLSWSVSVLGWRVWTLSSCSCQKKPSISSKVWKNWVDSIQLLSNSCGVISRAHLITAPVRYKGAKTRFLQLLWNRCALAMVYIPSWVVKTLALNPCLPSHLWGTETWETGVWYGNSWTVTGPGVFGFPVVVMVALMVSKQVSAYN